MNLEPAFDVFGYPNTETLETIKQWQIRSIEDCASLLQYVSMAWKYPEYACEIVPGRWIFATGGWSGSESLMTALDQNCMFVGLMNNRNLRMYGGLRVYVTSDEQLEELDRMVDRISAWAWKRGS